MRFKRGRRRWQRKKRSSRRFGRKRSGTRRRRRPSRGGVLGKSIVRYKCVEPDTAAALVDISNLLERNSYIQHRIDGFATTNLPYIRNLYQQARCVKCTYHIRPRVSGVLNIQSVPNANVNVGNSPPPDMYAYIDYETDAGAVSIQQAVAAGCRRISYSRGHSFTFVPATLMMSEESLGTTAYIVKKKQWFDTNDTPVYRGVRFFVPTWVAMPANMQPVGWNLTRTTYWEFRRLRYQGAV